MIDRLERSRLRLVRKDYYKVEYKGKVYYLVEKAYASSYDGYFDTKEITKQTYEKAELRGDRVKELDYNTLDKYMKRSIKKAIGIENYKEED